MSLKITPEVFDTFLLLLNEFDYWYNYSDDISCYRRGKAQEDVINIQMKGNPVLQEIHKNWVIKKTSKVPAAVDAVDGSIAAIRRMYVDDVVVESTVANDNMLYLQLRHTDTCKLMSSMKWESIDEFKTLRCSSLHYITITRDISHYNGSFKVRVHDDKTHYVFTSEADLLVWILKKYW